MINSSTLERDQQQFTKKKRKVTQMIRFQTLEEAINMTAPTSPNWQLEILIQNQLGS